MYRSLKNLVSIFVLLALTTAASAAPDRSAVVQRVRAELATLLKRDAATLPVEKSVLELGADELDIVEWVMAVEEAFHVPIPDDEVVDPKSKKTRKDLSIASMAALVSEALERVNKNQK